MDTETRVVVFVGIIIAIIVIVFLWVIGRHIWYWAAAKGWILTAALASYVM